MKNLTTAIWGQLAGSSLYTDVAGRLFKGRAPDGTSYPYVVYFVVTDMPDRVFDGLYEDVIIQFSLFSTASVTTEVEDMFTHLKTLYDEKSFSITGSTLIWMQRGNTSFSVEDHTTTKAGTQQVFAYHCDFNVKTNLD